MTDSFSNPLIQQYSNDIDRKKRLLRDYEVKSPELKRKLSDTERTYTEEKKKIDELEEKITDAKSELKKAEESFKRGQGLFTRVEDQRRFAKTDFEENVKNIEKITHEISQIEQKRSAETLRLTRNIGNTRHR